MPFLYSYKNNILTLKYKLSDIIDFIKHTKIKSLIITDLSCSNGIYEDTFNIIETAERMEKKQVLPENLVERRNKNYQWAKQLSWEKQAMRLLNEHLLEKSCILEYNGMYNWTHDLPQGNGDSSLLLFGRNITPNQHAISEQFVLLDNFYVDAEVSADGHSWSMGAYANDYNEKTWVTSYGGRGGTYDYEGQKNIASPKGGFLWDHALKARVSFRTYGEFADDYKANYTT